MDFSITEVESNSALAVGSAELPLVAALMAEQAKIKDREKQLGDHGFATFEFDNLPFIIESSGAWSVKAVALWKRIKTSHKAAVADKFATATFLNTSKPTLGLLLLWRVGSHRGFLLLFESGWHQPCMLELIQQS